MRIAGLAFIAVGAVVAVMSFALLQQQQSNKMILFLYAGIAMAIFGIARLYIDRALPQSQSKAHSSMEAELSNAFKEKKSLNQIPQVCSACSSRNHPQANFCGHCGNRLRW